MVTGFKVRSYPRPRRRGMVMPSGRNQPCEETDANKNSQLAEDHEKLKSDSKENKKTEKTLREQKTCTKSLERGS